MAPNDISPLVESVRQKEAQWTPDSLKKGDGLVSEAERDRLVRWLGQLAQRQGYGVDSLCLAVGVLDRMLAQTRVKHKYAGCLALSALYMATKVCEELEAIPEAADLLRGAQAEYSVTELVRMERVVLAQLGWQLDLSTVYRCLEIMLTGSFGDDGPTQKALWPELSDGLVTVLSSHRLLHSYAPSLLALAMLSLNLELRRYPLWFPFMALWQQLFQVDQSRLIACREHLSEIFRLDADKENSSRFKIGGKKARKRQRQMSRSSAPDEKLFIEVDELSDALHILYG